MDIQFVLDVYSCAIYIVSYIFKAQKGMSELLRTACEEAKRGNSSIKQQGRDSGVAFPLSRLAGLTISKKMRKCFIVKPKSQLCLF
jgi:hypothetical protein